MTFRTAEIKISTVFFRKSKKKKKSAPEISLGKRDLS